MMQFLLFALALASGALCAPPAHIPTPYQDLTNYHFYDNYDSFGVDGDDYSGAVESAKLEELEEVLVEALRTGGEPPIVFVEDLPVPVEPDLQQMVKRTRYYRRYGNKKRQTAKYYDPDGYLCAPSRDEVFRLLVALHEVRNGINDKTIQFCNRKRPAKAVFTNIRFLGRRR